MAERTYGRHIAGAAVAEGARRVNRTMQYGEATTKRRVAQTKRLWAQHLKNARNGVNAGVNSIVDSIDATGQSVLQRQMMRDSLARRASDASKELSRILEMAKSNHTDIMRRAVDKRVGASIDLGKQLIAADDAVLAGQRDLARLHEQYGRAKASGARVLKETRAAGTRAVKAAAGPRTLAEQMVDKARKISGVTKKGVSAVNPLKPGAAGEIGKVLGRGARMLTTSSWKVPVVSQLGAIGKWGLVKGPAYILDKGGAAIGSRLAGNLAGKAVGVVGRAAFGPGSLAASAWIDAGMNAYDFFTSETFKSGLDKDAKIDWAGFNRDYWNEAWKGLKRTVTLGFFGNGDALADSFEADGLTPAERDAQIRKAADSQNPLGKQVADVPAYVGVDGKVVQAHKGSKIEQIEVLNQLNAQEARTRAVGGGKIDSQGFRDYVAGLAKVRDERLAKYAGVRDNWDAAVRENRQLARMDAAGYYEQAAARENERYERSIEAAMKNPVARQVMGENMRAAYQMFTGRDYDRDYDADGRKSGSIEAFTEFNRLWNQMDDRDRALWNKETAHREFDEEMANGSQADLNGGSTGGSWMRRVHAADFGGETKDEKNRQAQQTPVQEQPVEVSNNGVEQTAAESQQRADMARQDPGNGVEGANAGKSVDQILEESRRASAEAKAAVGGLHAAQAGLREQQKSTAATAAGLAETASGIEKAAPESQVGKDMAAVSTGGIRDVAAATAARTNDRPSPGDTSHLFEWSRAGNVSTYYDNNGSQTVDHVSGRIVFAQPGRQLDALDSASKHTLRSFVPISQVREATIGAKPAKTVSAQSAPAFSSLRRNVPVRGGGYTDIYGVHHDEPKSRVLGREMPGLGGGLVSRIRERDRRRMRSQSGVLI